MTAEQNPTRSTAATDAEAARDITRRLADVADGLEIGAVPHHAVMRGGRRRKARRWVVGALAAVAIAGSTGSLALAVVDGGPRVRTASEGGTAAERHVHTPGLTRLTELYDKAGAEVGAVELQVWGAPRDDEEARGQKKAMVAAGVWDERTSDPAPNFHQPWYAIVVKNGGKEKVVSFGLQDRDPGGGDGLGFASVETTVNGETLTIGHVGPRTERVEYEFENGTVEPDLHKAAGSGYLWFTQGKPDGELGKPQVIRLYDGEGRVEGVVRED
ncbi:hypothetical protein SALBM135S_00604 [Streptomyces alboniger]